MIICKSKIIEACNKGDIKTDKNIIINLIRRIPIVPVNTVFEKNFSSFCYDVNELLSVIEDRLKNGRLRRPDAYEDLANYIKKYIGRSE